MYTALAPQKSEQAKREIVSTVGGSVVSAISPTDLMVRKSRQNNQCMIKFHEQGFITVELLTQGKGKNIVST